MKITKCDIEEYQSGSKTLELIFSDSGKLLIVKAYENSKPHYIFAHQGAGQETYPKIWDDETFEKAWQQFQSWGIKVKGF